IFTVDMVEKFRCHGETDWDEYSHEPGTKTYWGYSKAGTAVFMLLGPLAFAFLVTLSRLTGGFQWRPLLWLPTVAVVLNVAMVGAAGWARQRLIDEDAIRRNWKHAITRAGEKRKKVPHGG